MLWGGAMLDHWNFVGKPQIFNPYYEGKDTDRLYTLKKGGVIKRLKMIGYEWYTVKTHDL